jgi:two-component system response regulator NreC
LKKELNILIINDYPIIVEAYKKILLGNKKYKLNLETCNSFGQTTSILNSSTYDIVFIDLELVSSGNCINMSGERLAILTRDKLPKAKIVLIMSDNKSRIHNIIETIPYDGLLIKKDITSEVVIDVLETVSNNSNFYSETIRNVMSEIEFQNMCLDELDKRILYYLSVGVRTKNLVKYISLSLSAIEKRKCKIKILFNAKSDEELLEKARVREVIS